ncbi:MAG TPA: type IV pilus assembly protein PilM [Phycisphaerae bacterium]|nr:type IV pilus assembly protein PilM [Phycisphaerae bacterium]
MATLKSVWGIDIGQCALKALKLREVNGELQVEAFDIIEHPKILSQPDADRKQLIRNSLEQFLARNNVAGSAVAVSVPGQSSFTRFVKLPPVETKRIPDIVRFEAEQQIPFPINDVIWRWQTFQDPDSPDIEVGIFAMKKVDVADMLEHYTDVGVSVDAVQMAPLSLYNFMTFDEQLAADGATLLADVGADKTDLVVADKARIWTRTIQIGGNNFTEALVKAFKLSFAKAEKLKRTAATSKYARQIFQAMRPVFADLVQEIQRSIGYYTSLHRETRFKRLVGLGNGFRLPGLQKFLEQNLSIPVARIDSYNKLSPSPAVNAPMFTENVLSFAVAYGLALQGLDLTSVSTNLLPAEIARKRIWAKKNPWFAAAAAVLVAATAMPLYRSYADRATLQPGAKLEQARHLLDEMQRVDREEMQVENQGKQELEQIQVYKKMFAYRDWWPQALTLVSQSMASVATDQGFVTDYAVAATGAERQKILDQLGAKPRRMRKMLFLESLSPVYLADIQTSFESIAQTAGVKLPTSAAPAAAATPSFGGPGEYGPTATPAATVAGQRGMAIVLVARTPMSRDLAQRELLAPLLRNLRELPAQLNFQQMEVNDLNLFFLETQDAPSATGGHMAMGGSGSVAGAPAGPKLPDPMFPAEDMVGDERFVIILKLAIKDETSGAR